MLSVIIPISLSVLFAGGSSDALAGYYYLRAASDRNKPVTSHSKALEPVYHVTTSSSEKNVIYHSVHHVISLWGRVHAGFFPFFVICVGSTCEAEQFTLTNGDLAFFLFSFFFFFFLLFLQVCRFALRILALKATKLETYFDVGFGQRLGYNSMDSKWGDTSRLYFSTICGFTSGICEVWFVCFSSSNSSWITKEYNEGVPGFRSKVFVCVCVCVVTSARAMTSPLWRNDDVMHYGSDLPSMDCCTAESTATESVAALFLLPRWV